MNATLIPTTGARWLRNEMDRLFERAWNGEELPMFGEWVPRVDLLDSPEALIAKVEVPGMDPKDIRVTLEHNVLTIKGEKRAEMERKDERVLRVERAYGTFERSLKLPATVDIAKVNATFKNGLLEIMMPKAPEAKGTTIPIKFS